EGLAPGLHQVEVEAGGFEIARAEVHVEKGRSHGVKLVLDRTKPQPPSPEPESPAPAAVAPEVTSLAGAHGAKTRDRHMHAAKSESEERDAARERSPSTNKPVKGAAYDPTAAQNNVAADGAEGVVPAPTASTAPIVEQGGSSETQVSDGLDEQLVAADEGELLISTVPWSHVFVDEEDTERDTPVRSLRVPAGPHRIGLRTPDGVMHQVDVVVEAGQVVRIIRRF
ncbi:MAG TPA: hypothetical protein VG963_12285, partial [Polyangiaceae bacterium]|nr:hypothetical protein [Polyangiaceae bacterium]